MQKGAGGVHLEGPLLGMLLGNVFDFKYAGFASADGDFGQTGSSKGKIRTVVEDFGAQILRACSAEELHRAVTVRGTDSGYSCR